MKTKDQIIEEQRKKINELERNTGKAGGGSQAITQQNLINISKKLAALFPEVRKIAYNEMMSIATDGGTAELMPTFLIKTEMPEGTGQKEERREPDAQSVGRYGEALFFRRNA